MDDKDRLVRTAIKLFISKGFDDISIEDVEDDAGIAKGTASKFFRTKASLFYCAFGSLAKEESEEIQRAVSAAETGFDMFKGIGLALSDYSQKHPEINKMRIMSLSVIPDDHDEYVRAFASHGMNNYRLMVESLDKAVKDGSIKKEFGPEMTALWVTITGMIP
jgi:AcrR family transcriptional regulator